MNNELYTPKYKTILRIVALKDIDAECIMIGWNPHKTLFFALEAFYSNGFTDLKVDDRFLVATDDLYAENPEDVYIQVIRKISESEKRAAKQWLNEQTIHMPKLHERPTHDL